ncbi:MAG: energy transducer TonB [Acidobacteriota bacterium]
MADIDTLPPPPTHQAEPGHAEPDQPSQPEIVHLSGELKEDGIFASLLANIRDAFFSPKLPPLVLESKPIPVPDRMATKRSPASAAIAVGIHVLAILLIALLIASQVKVMTSQKNLATVSVPTTPPPLAPRLQAIGGGGGQHDLAPVSRGRLPVLAQKQIVPPMAPPTVAPKLAVVPTVVVQKNINLANNALPNLGMPTSPLKGISLGNGTGTGIGSGSGSGIGPGSGGNMGGGVMHIGGDISSPVVIYEVEPEFSEEARKAKLSGNVVVYLWVDADGKPSHVRVVRGIGMGLDQKAVDAVRQYRFRPAMKDGKPVAVDMYIEVNFQIL